MMNQSATVLTINQTRAAEQAAVDGELARGVDRRREGREHDHRARQGEEPGREVPGAQG